MDHNTLSSVDCFLLHAQEHGSATLVELGLSPQALLFVQPVDDD
jgi:hypothetical protein